MKNKKIMIHKTKLFFICLIIFIILSFLYIHPMDKSVESLPHSYELRTVSTKDSKIQRIDYVNSEGIITIAANLGYASCVTTEVENGILEKYYDDHGNPTQTYLGCYAVLSEFDENGNIYKKTYLDDAGKLVITHNGYAIEKKEYYENKQEKKCSYYDTEGKPILTKQYGYGKVNEYDEKGRINKIIYIDEFGEPMLTGQGYAVVKRYYYESDEEKNGKVKTEFYFDENGNPVKLSLGQYGVYKQYDEYGRESNFTYLDERGEPIVTTKGYTTIIRTYHANNSIATEQYYNLEGKPISLSEGQYGIKKDDGYTVYLNKNGEKVFNLKRFLYNHPRTVIIAAIMVTFLSSISEKKMNSLFFILYLCIILYLTLLNREGDNTYEVAGFLWSYRRIIIDSEVRAQIIKNIWLFIPLGAILYQITKRKGILIIPIILSIVIEGIQCFTGLGFCEFDDVISNTIGGYLGFCFVKLTTDLLIRIKFWRHISKVKRR
ncbi:VanZ family protein [Clostridiales bacterium FE2011]|nr:VanZ family protein [Clostridiales bacterium FE2011]